MPALKTRDKNKGKQEAFNKDTRCDQCGAQAYVAAVRNSIPALFFCIHHADKNSKGLVSQGFVMDDRRWAL